jgi:2-octaprenylphenol hydroxylase
MMAAMQAFKWGFGSRHPAATMLRNVGLTAVDAMPLAKRWFIKQAVGEG